MQICQEMLYQSHESWKEQYIEYDLTLEMKDTESVVLLLVPERKKNGRTLQVYSK